MRRYNNERILIISNNVLSNTNNNGKTILSYFDTMNCKQIRQLYFSCEDPSLSEYQYFRISDKDVIRGKFFPQLRGGRAEVKCSNRILNSYVKNYSEFMRLLREILWYKSWKSKQLIKWLDEFRPSVIFFVGGDCCFAYNICMYITKRFNSRLSLYITDDYFMPRKREKVFHMVRRYIIRRSFIECLKLTDVFFTISKQMSQKYEKEFGKKSFLAVNMTEVLKDTSIEKEENIITMIYAGSTYYGREDILGRLSKEIEKLNKNQKELKLKIYSNNKLNKNELRQIIKGKHTYYGGALSKEELIVELNKADVLVFVESFSEDQIEKTKYSLSTKVPEYLSLGKPILAIGPEGIGSMEYLKEASLCVYEEDKIEEALKYLLSSDDLRRQLARLAEEKFLKFNNKRTMQEEFLKEVMGYAERGFINENITN